MILVPFVGCPPAAAPLAPVDALEALWAHQARHPVPRDTQLELALHFGVHAAGAVRAAAVLVNGLDDFREDGIGDVPRGCGARSPGVAAAPGDPQEPGHQRHTVVRLLSLDEAIGFYRASRAK